MALIRRTRRQSPEMAGRMRQRRHLMAEDSAPAPSQPLAERFASEFKRFDVYTKLEDDYKVQTRTGGTGAPRAPRADAELPVRS